MRITTEKMREITGIKDASYYKQAEVTYAGTFGKWWTVALFNDQDFDGRPIYLETSYNDNGAVKQITAEKYKDHIYRSIGHYALGEN